MSLKTDYKDDVFAGNRKYRKTDNPDGTISLADATTYNQVGSTFAAADINATNAAINTLKEMSMHEAKASDWSATAPYKQRIDIARIKEGDTPVLSFIVPSWITDPNYIKPARKAYSCLTKVLTYNGYIELICLAKKPSTNFIFSVKGA